VRLSVIRLAASFFSNRFIASRTEAYYSSGVIMAREEMNGKRVLITGASRGLGRAMAVEFARQGHWVAACSRSEKKVVKLSKELGSPHSCSVVDVSDDAAVETWAKEVVDELGPPDLLLNNAAIINRNRFLWDVPVDEFDKIIDVNIKGVTNVIRHFMPPMARRGCGVIVNFSSGWGRSASPEVAPYCATKWAIEGLSQALAQELPEGMAAVPLNPGIINTDMLRSCFGPSAADFQSPEEWARVAVPFLLDLGPSHNGRALTVG
jgi:NAD(P)-dependent dehydrogenase (short-subunit alcohol dehydrogenase family)